MFHHLGREPVLGGQRSSDKEKLRIVVPEVGTNRELTMLLKWTSPAEVVAVRAANQVPLAWVARCAAHRFENSVGRPCSR